MAKHARHAQPKNGKNTTRASRNRSSARTDRASSASATRSTQASSDPGKTAPNPISAQRHAQASQSAANTQPNRPVSRTAAAQPGQTRQASAPARSARTASNTPAQPARQAGQQAPRQAAGANAARQAANPQPAQAGYPADYPAQGAAYAQDIAYAQPMRSAYVPVVPQKRQRKKGGCLVSLLLMITLLLLLVAALLIVRPSFVNPLLEGVFGIKSAAPAEAIIMDVDDVKLSEEAKAAQTKEKAHKRYLVAQCQGVDIYSSISQDELTGVIMHQASYEWGQVMTTEVTEADMTEYEASGTPLRVNNEQTEGEWVDADMAHLYRETDATEMDTALDLGAPAGTTVYAPVTGEVIAVEEYDLYDETPDIRIHIRPDANPDLDVVLLHQEGPLVSVGDKVVAGETPISKVRDIASHLTDIQLAFYTATDGNHSHVQVNDLHNAEYVAKYNLPAI